MPKENLADYLFAAFNLIIIGIATWAGLLVLALLPVTIFIVVNSLIISVSAILAFYGYTMNFAFNTMILDIVFQNDIAVSADMISWHFVVWLLGFTALGIALSWQRKRYKIEWKNPIAYAVLTVSVVILAVCLYPGGRLQRPIVNRIPYNIPYVTYQYLSNRKTVETKRPRTFETAICDAKDLTCVVVLGEAARSANFGINGYHRQTTPNLERLNVLSFDNIYSEETYTNVSLPHMLTRADSTNIDRAYCERSFIDVFNFVGFNTTFIANQDAEKTYTYFVNEASKVVNANTTRTVYTYDKWLDGDILPHFQTELDSNLANQLIVIHTIGSHWWYNSHYPDEFTKFQPIIQSRVLSNCDSLAMVNSYDNTILYTDFVLSQMIEKLTNRNAIFIYMSDHGEALGEENQWLHASDCEAMHRPAAFVWFSEKYAAENPEKVANLKANCHKFYRTDVLFHSVIDAANIQTDIFEPSLSIFR